MKNIGHEFTHTLRSSMPHRTALRTILSTIFYERFGTHAWYDTLIKLQTTSINNIISYKLLCIKQLQNYIINNKYGNEQYKR